MHIFTPLAGIRLLLITICTCAALTGLHAQVHPTHGAVSGNVKGASHSILQGNVIANSTNEPIALASVSWKNTQQGGVTDSIGHFQLPRNTKPDTLIISCVGFLTIEIPIRPHDTTTLNIRLAEKQGEKVEVLAKYSRGLLWWRQIVRHKATNNPGKSNVFSSDLYRKLELDLNNLTREGFQKTHLLKPFAFIADNIDTVTEKRPFLPVFMKETFSRYYSSSRPRKRREEIQAIQTSGLNNESVLKIVEGLEQSVNVYDNYITLFGKEFISPLSTNGDAHYQYRGADTQYIDGQRYLHLFFAARHPGENTFSGSCWIHQPTWAVNKISLDISSTANINFVHRLTIHQEFLHQADTAWVFAKDQFIAEISPLKNDKLSLIARQTLLYQKVSLDPPGIVAILGKNTQPDQVVEGPGSRTQSLPFWESKRPEPLSANEQKVYRMSDTLRNLPAFQSYARTAELIIDGHKKFGKWELGPWYKWVSGNQHEKLRLRFDLATTPQFSKQLRLHGYLAYGTHDNAFKGQIDGRYRFPGDGGYTVQAAYWHDLDNGRLRSEDEGVTADNLFSNLIRRPGIRQKFVQVDEIRTAVGKEWHTGFSIKAAFSRASYNTFNPLPPQKMISTNQRDIISTEVGLRLRYAPGEKKLTTPRKDRRFAGDHPVFDAGFTAGIPRIAGSQYAYQKANLAISQHLRLPGWGQLQYQLFGGKIWGKPLPFMLLEVHPGNETFYYARQYFNLMSRFEYVSDEYAGFMVEHHFDKKLLNWLPVLRRTNIRQFWNVKAVWGDLAPENKKLNRWEYGTYHMRSLNGRSYMELGTGLDNIFTYFRLDAVWRFSPPSASMAPTHRFGMFGSFHIQF
jgi:hypothetical protein